MSISPKNETETSNSYQMNAILSSLKQTNAVNTSQTVDDIYWITNELNVKFLLTISWWVAKPNLIPVISPSKIVEEEASSISFKETLRYCSGKEKRKRGKGDKCREDCNYYSKTNMQIYHSTIIKLKIYFKK